MTVLSATPPGSSAPRRPPSWPSPPGRLSGRPATGARLRALVADEHRAAPLPAGAYVFHVDPPAADMTFATLSATLHDLLTAVRPPVTA